MTFDYNTLKRAARDGLRLGNWNGKAVFAASATQLQNLGTGAYYILYDDENKIVSRSAANNGWKSYGEVSESGSVQEYSSARNYRTVEANPTYGRKIPKETPPAVAHSAPAAAVASYAPGYDRTERPTGDVKLEIDVEKVLQNAREMTVESLLEGFLPGVVGQGPRKG